VTRTRFALSLILVAACSVQTATSSTTTGTVGATGTGVSTTFTLPGTEAPSIFEPGDVLGVIGVASGESLLLLSFPGESGEAVFELGPLEDGLEALGTAWEIDGVPWERLLLAGHEGYLPRSMLAFIGEHVDVSAQFVEMTFGSVTELGREIAGEIEAEQMILIARPSPLENVYDVIGLGDDSIAGYRIRVVAREISGGYAPDLVHRSPLCARGVTETGLCL